MADILPLAALGPRICIFGPSNAGKSTLAAALSRKLDAPAVFLDVLRFEPNTNWTMRSEPAFEALHDAAIAGESWIIEGNYMGLVQSRLLRATGLIQIGSSRLPAFGRYLRRAMIKRNRVGRVEGAGEAINWKMTHFILVEQPKKRARDTAILKSTGLPLIQISSMADLKRHYDAWDLRPST